eukprot:NODE_968_length_1083_cov_253.843096_g924_i0.p1 GENE.NODE_968_length_1083_cov_253.843096_g924_i0~~NODE_968_length_1083_cov_253.843096_g924_i0.p1  ORF type:complete len:206 (-),score=50.00 NODE_968_length_1083_cov_253.843096_g924_i0:292-909(-)
MPCCMPAEMYGSAADWTQKGVTCHNPYDVPATPTNQYYSEYYCQEACCAPYRCQEPCCAPVQCQGPCCVPVQCQDACCAPYTQKCSAYIDACCYDEQPPTPELHHVHDPYSFVAYHSYTVEATKEAKVEEKPVVQEPVQAPVCEETRPKEIIDEAEALKRAIQEARRAHVTPPCGHDNFKRLRFKKGLSHYLCLTCSTKWRQAGV